MLQKSEKLERTNAESANPVHLMQQELLKLREQRVELENKTREMELTIVSLKQLRDGWELQALKMAEQVRIANKGIMRLRRRYEQVFQETAKLREEKARLRRLEIKSRG